MTCIFAVLITILFMEIKGKLAMTYHIQSNEYNVIKLVLLISMGLYLMDTIVTD
jgi:hypothetical protein